MASVAEPVPALAKARETTAAVVVVAESRSAAIDRLAHGTPTERLEAYDILQSCWLARNAETLPRPLRNGADQAPAEACAGILGGQESMRLPLLAEAARARLPTAAAALRNVWEAGDIDRPRFEAQFGQILDAYAAAGDEWARTLRTGSGAAPAASTAAAS